MNPKYILWNKFEVVIVRNQHLQLKPNLNIIKYGVNRVNRGWKRGEVPRVSEREGEAFVVQRASKD